ncbi:hypothetical protein EON83_11390 [bacterium]|nr:MAG: hypothetical protein EON83_11390 [bacterium]
MESLSETAIRARVETKIFERGEEYWRHGAVLSVVKRGESLRAKVEGSDYEPYSVVIRWQSDGEVEATCDCPYAEEMGDWCKHIVAVLLEYDNEIVEELPPIREALQKLSQEQLLDLIVEASERNPEVHDTIIAVFNGEDLDDEDSEYDY